MLKTINMKVLIINTSEKRGGAAIAAARLRDALISRGVETKMLVCKKESDNPTIVELRPAWKTQLNFLIERFLIWANNGFTRKHLFDIDTASHGTDITSLPEFKEADIIHFHWINQGMLSLKGIRKIILSGKPIVWTLHDMWPFTGICHHARNCRNFTTHCRECDLLTQPHAHDLSEKVMMKKEKLFKNSNIYFIGCSKWMANEARQSQVIRGLRITDIPNPLNTNIFKPTDKTAARKANGLPQDKKLVLFSAFKTTTPAKGINYFIDTCRLYHQLHPEMQNKMAIVAVGKEADTIINEFPYHVYDMGYIGDEKTMVSIYNACDVFFMPSLQENLPNTIAEAMACGVPCIASAIGGIPQMINHLENGYLAHPKDFDDMANGLDWYFNQCNQTTVQEAARAFAVSHYDERNITAKYVEIYNTIITHNHE